MPTVQHAPKLYIDELSGLLKTTLQGLSTELGLKGIYIGDWTSLPSPDNYSTSLPCLYISFIATGQPELRMNRIRCDYQFRVRYFRAQLDTDLGESAKLVNQACARIWQTLQCGSDPAKPTIPAYFGTAYAGFVWESVVVNGPSLLNEDNAHMNFLEFAVNCAWVDLTITGTSTPYTTNS